MEALRSCLNLKKAQRYQRDNKGFKGLLNN